MVCILNRKQNIRMINTTTKAFPSFSYKSTSLFVNTTKMPRNLSEPVYTTEKLKQQKAISVYFSSGVEKS